MTTQAPPATAPPAGQTADLPDAPSQVQDQLQNPSAYPVARPLPPAQDPDPVDISSSGPESEQNGHFTLNQDVVITYKDRRVQADHIEYDRNTGDVTLTGHVIITGPQEHIAASHGTYNLNTQAGRFYDVSGTYGFQASPRARRTTYTTDSPFVFTGRVVVKNGPDSYDVYDGTVTSCQFTNPDWLLSAAHISMQDDIAKAHNTVFHLLNLPILFFPYVTHPADEEARTSGFLIPTIGLSNRKGLILGEEIFFAINRSLDARVGAAYYSHIGWAMNDTLRYRGVGLDFAMLHFTQVMDRRSGSLQQGGEEFLLNTRHDLSLQTRAAANIDYLSSYVYREAFSDNFNQAVTSDIVSDAYISRNANGIELAAFADRYQGIKLIAQGTNPQEQVHLFHVPTLSLQTTEHLVPGTSSAVSNGLEVSLESSASGLKRTQPSFATGGIIERFDLHPQGSYPITLRDWHIIPSLAARETIYSRSRFPSAPGQPLTQNEAALSRSDFEFGLNIRPPVVERTFHPTHLTSILGTEVRHTIAPELTYRLADGINNFADILRFDAIDVASNTNELEYGATQHLYTRKSASLLERKGKPCPTQQYLQSSGFNSDAPNTVDDMSNGEDLEAAAAPQPDASGITRCPSEELISWRLTQRFFFDQTFGGAVVRGRRNIFTSTLDLSGVAFLSEPRLISPLVSRLRLRTSAHADIAWDFDLDTSLKKFNSSNVYVDLHQGNAFGALSYARLDAPGRFFTESPDSTVSATGAVVGTSSSVSDFNQLRVLVGYGNPTRPGLSLAANSGIDLKHLYGVTSTIPGPNGIIPPPTYPPLLQYATVQASYNWNCCGLAIEYRKLELGSANNEGEYRFNFTLANIGAAGNLRRTERLF